MNAIAFFLAWACAAPAPDEPPDAPIADHATFLPRRSFAPLGGKVVGVLVPRPEPVLAEEGRAGPDGQLCLSVAASSYRWVYVADGDAKIGSARVPLPGGKSRLFDGLSMASAPLVARWGVPDRLVLVEAEVNGGDGGDGPALVATAMAAIDGTERFPPKLPDALAAARKKYDAFLSEEGKAIDAKLTALGRDALKGKPTGPRETSTITYVTWLPDTSRVQVRYVTRVTDGAYRYVGGLRIDTGAAPIPAGPPAGGDFEPARLPFGGRYGTQITAEVGMLLEVDRAGKVVTARPLTVEGATREIREPALRPVPKRRDR